MDEPLSPSWKIGLNKKLFKIDRGFKLKNITPPPPQFWLRRCRDDLRTPKLTEMTEMTAIIQMIISNLLNHKFNINFPIYIHPSTTKSSNKLITKFTSNASNKFLQKRLFPNFTNELMLRLNNKSSISLSSKWEYD